MKYHESGNRRSSPINLGFAKHGEPRMRIKGSALGHAGKDLYLWHVAMVKVKVEVIGERSIHEEVAGSQPEKGLDRQWQLEGKFPLPYSTQLTEGVPREENEEGNEQQTMSEKSGETFLTQPSPPESSGKEQRRGESRNVFRSKRVGSLTWAKN